MVTVQRNSIGKETQRLKILYYFKGRKEKCYFLLNIGNICLIQLYILFFSKILHLFMLK